MKSFIGKKFPTRRGGTLTVISEAPYVKGKGDEYFLKCSICSEDKEMNPDLFKCSRAKLNRGITPCGCATSRKLSKGQYLIRIERECNRRKNIEFISFSDKWEGVETKIKLRCKIDDNMWDTTSIGSFLSGRGCPKCKFAKASKNNSIPDETMIETFMSSGKFKDGCTFKRNRVKRDYRGQLIYWDYTCPVCSNDEYVKEGLCNGVFISTASSLKIGRLPCRCSPYRWTQQQREYQIKTVMDKEGLTLLGWEAAGYKDAFSKFRWLCSKGHECETQIHPFLKGNRCITCSGGVNGFYPHRLDEEDFLYLLNFNYEYWKIGRSFDIDDRMKGLSSSSKIPLNKISVVMLHKGRHEDIYKTEQDIIYTLNQKDLLIGKHSGRSGDFSSETILPEGLSDVIELLNNTELTKKLYKIAKEI